MDAQNGLRKGKRQRKPIAATLRVNLGKDLAEKFNELKRFHGIETDTEMVRMLIQKRWKEDIEKKEELKKQ